MNLKECYIAAGGDYDDVMRRFMTEERVDRFLVMFLKDQSFVTLCEAMAAKQYEEAFHAVHTMKGICMNMSLTDLAGACIALTENLRSGQPDGQTSDCFINLKANYKKTVEAIGSHLQQPPFFKE